MKKEFYILLIVLALAGLYWYWRSNMQPAVITPPAVQPVQPAAAVTQPLVSPKTAALVSAPFNGTVMKSLQAEQLPVSSSNASLVSPGVTIQTAPKSEVIDPALIAQQQAQAAATAATQNLLNWFNAMNSEVTLSNFIKDKPVAKRAYVNGCLSVSYIMDSQHWCLLTYGNSGGTIMYIQYYNSSYPNTEFMYWTGAYIDPQSSFPTTIEGQAPQGVSTSRGSD